jgi:hypothetical protein
MFTQHTTRIPAVSLTAALLLFLVGALSPASAQDTTRSSTLRDALDNQFVKAAICSIGLSSGYAIIMAIKSQIGSALRVRVPSGTVLKSGNSAEQSMVVHGVVGEYDNDVAQDISEECAKHAAEEERNTKDKGLSDHWLDADSITLDPYQAHLYLLSAYCLEFEKDNPSSSDRFTAIGQANDETTRLFRLLDGKLDAYEPVVIQLATWAVNGNVSAAHIAEKFDFSVQDRSKACGLLNAAGIAAGRKALCAQ